MHEVRGGRRELPPGERVAHAAVDVHLLVDDHLARLHARARRRLENNNYYKNRIQRLFPRQSFTLGDCLGNIQIDFYWV